MSFRDHVFAPNQKVRPSRLLGGKTNKSAMAGVDLVLNCNKSLQWIMLAEKLRFVASG